MADLARAMETPLPSGTDPDATRPSAPDTGTVVRKPRRAASVPGSSKRNRRNKTRARLARQNKPAKKAAAAAPKAKRVSARNAVSMDLSDALGLVQGMHRTDVNTFQTLSEHLTGKGKPSRKRLLAALNKVFG